MSSPARSALGGGMAAAAFAATLALAQPKSSP